MFSGSSPGGRIFSRAQQCTQIGPPDRGVARVPLARLGFSRVCREGVHLESWASAAKLPAALGRIPLGQPILGGRTSEAERGPEEAKSLPSGSPVSGSDAAPPPHPDVVISLHPHGLSSPRHLPPYKAALPPRDTGMRSHPLHRWELKRQRLSC